MTDGYRVATLPAHLVNRPASCRAECHTCLLRSKSPAIVGAKEGNLHSCHPRAGRRSGLSNESNLPNLPETLPVTYRDKPPRSNHIGDRVPAVLPYRPLSCTPVHAPPARTVRASRVGAWAVTRNSKSGSAVLLCPHRSSTRTHIVPRAATPFNHCHGTQMVKCTVLSSAPVGAIRALPPGLFPRLSDQHHSRWFTVI